MKKLSLLSCAAAVAGIVALSLPALAQTNTPAPAPSAASTQAAPVAKADSKTKKVKTHTIKKHDSMMKTAKTDTGHKPAPAPVKADAPASNAGK
jgi:L,D-peptidoglycan transpeptidase YkuD (ErfK/YbiS/YcfS/YnhG family)